MALIGTALPWVNDTPFSLISWWDMQKFTADAFFTIGRSLAEIKNNYEKMGNVDREIEARAHQDGTKGHQFLMAIKNSCQQIGLGISVRSVNYFFSLDATGMKVGQAIDLLEQLKRTITWEMQEKLFMFIPPEQAVFYDQPELFGKEVNSRFPSIQFDVIEAGNCYAAGRATAVVFHLMRIMEVGVQEFGNKLGINLVGEKVWQVILDGINPKIKALLPKDQRTVELAQAAANLYAVKLAWRNEVMHPKETYTLEEADNLIRQVRLFMENLATII